MSTRTEGTVLSHRQDGAGACCVTKAGVNAGRNCAGIVVKGRSVNALIIDPLKAEIEWVRQDKDFTGRAKRLLERDRELLERLAE